MLGGCKRAVVLSMMSVLMGCGEAQIPATAGGQEALRTQRDAVRTWVLDLEGVRVYDAGSNRLIRRIEIPGWSVVRFACPPGLAIDRSGSAYVASNVLSRLWRIDATTFKVEEFQITLRDRERWDVGFGALAFTPDGRLLAVTALAGTLWHIDVNDQHARLVGEGANLVNACELTEPYLSKFDRSKQP